jgi:hypothetical protein
MPLEFGAGRVDRLHGHLEVGAKSDDAEVLFVRLADLVVGNAFDFRWQA